MVSMRKELDKALVKLKEYEGTVQKLDAARCIPEYERHMRISNMYK